MSSSPTTTSADVAGRRADDPAGGTAAPRTEAPRTEAPRREASPRASDAERLRLALRTGRLGWWEWEVEGGGVTWSPEVEALHGMAPGTFRGTFAAYAATIHPDDRARVLGEIERVVSERRGHYAVRYRYLRTEADGAVTTRWLDGEACLTLDGGRPVRLVGVVGDATERVEAEQSAEFLVEASAILGGTLELDATLAALTSLAVPRLADWCAVDLLEDGVVRRVAVHHADPAKLSLARTLQERYPPRLDDASGVGSVLRTGQAEIVPEIPDELLVAATQDAEHLALARALGFRSYIIVPLDARGRRLGALTLVQAESGRRHGDRALRVAQELARRAAAAVENARLFEETRAANAELQRRAEQLEEQRAELEMSNAQLQEQQVELEAQTTQMQEQQVELEAQTLQLQEQQVELEMTNAHLQENAVELELQAEELLQRTRDLERETAAAERARGELARVFEQAPVAVCVLRGRDLTFELANPGYRELVGGRELMGRRLEEAIPELEPEVVAVLRRVLESGEPFVATEWRVALDRDGDGRPEDYFFNLVYTPLLDGDGAVSGVVVVANEVSDQVRGRRAAEEANAAKSQFLAAMSHELRTPLNAVTGYADLLSLGIRGHVTAEQREDLARIKRSGEHLLRLINDILQFAKLEAGQLEFRPSDVVLTTTLAELEALVAPQVRAKGLAYEFAPCEPDAGMPPVAVRADRDKLQQIVLNLLSNAIKATEPGGTIRLECGQQTAADGRERVVVRVIDSGVGIAADKLDTIFDPFVQVDRKLNRPSEGVGLGLAISRDLARAMGGDLTVESTVNQGSVFTLALPRL